MDRVERQRRAQHLGRRILDAFRPQIRHLTILPGRAHFEPPNGAPAEEFGFAARDHFPAGTGMPSFGERKSMRSSRRRLVPRRTSTASEPRSYRRCTHSEKPTSRGTRGRASSSSSSSPRAAPERWTVPARPPRRGGFPGRNRSVSRQAGGEKRYRDEAQPRQLVTPPDRLHTAWPKEAREQANRPAPAGTRPPRSSPDPAGCGRPRSASTDLSTMVSTRIWFTKSPIPIDENTTSVD